jgi:hypothetical protein
MKDLQIEAHELYAVIKHTAECLKVDIDTTIHMLHTAINKESLDYFIYRSREILDRFSVLSYQYHAWRNE